VFLFFLFTLPVYNGEGLSSFIIHQDRYSRSWFLRIRMIPGPVYDGSGSIKGRVYSGSGNPNLKGPTSRRRVEPIQVRVGDMG